MSLSLFQLLQEASPEPTSLPKVIRKEGRVAAKVSPHWLQLTTKSTPSRGPIPNPTTCLIPGPVRPMMPNGIRIRSAVFTQCTGQIDPPTDRPTHRPRESLMTIARYASNESGAV